MIQTQTFELPKTDEIETLAAALELLMHGNAEDATKILVARHDQLTNTLPLRLYWT